MDTTFRVTTYDIVISTFPLFFQKHKELGTLKGDTLTLILKIFLIQNTLKVQFEQIYYT